ncbi:MAG: divergent polysaccharide deacetylase family protein [Paracoccaceae bacterium]|nr:divergent polysaccharide deacetylase family protein [Paracoccaceae bacterium]MDG2258349.1 divergent polysaccharide deacetylase family protein [Paracoccaceae bacterium]
MALLADDITSRAALNLERMTEAYPEVELLMLVSNGGDAHAALMSAKIIDEMGWQTYIPIESGCYSACAFLYFAGSIRYADGELGVHQTSSEIESNYASQLTVADILEVLSNFQVDQRVYQKMFSTHPEDMYVFSERELREFGLLGERKSVSGKSIVQPVAPMADEVTFEEAPVETTEQPSIAIAEELPAEATPTPQMSAPLIDDLPTLTGTGSAASDGPLVQNSQTFENPDNLPVMSIVLIETGEYNIGSDALASFPYPITFAIDPLSEDTLERAAAYRERGFELLAVANLPSSGGEELADLALLPTLDSVPGLVGILEGAGEGLQGNMELSEGVLRMLEATGYGLLLRSNGLNAAQQMAEGRGLPVETIFRDFDANGQNATVIRSLLDQAAFKARQEGSIVMVGRLRPATISALLLWGLQDRASSVALAPVSAVLTQ